jgi:hypothetical protein
MDFPLLLSANLGILLLALFSTFLRLLIGVWYELIHEDFYLLCIIKAASSFVGYLMLTWVSAPLQSVEGIGPWLVFLLVLVTVAVASTMLIIVAPALLAKIFWWVIVVLVDG